MKGRFGIPLAVLLSLAPGMVILPDRPSLAQGDEECRGSWARERDAGEEAGWAIRELGAADRARFVAAYNADEPKTDYHSDHVYVGAHPRAGYAIVELVKGEDCLLDGAQVPLPVLDRVLRAPDAPS